MRTRIVVAAFAIAAACAPTPAQPAPGARPAEAAPPAAAGRPPAAAPAADEASCRTAGGDWRPICRMQKPACVITYKDGGKSCSDGSQCQGDCVAEITIAAAVTPATGKCSTSSDPCGCKTLITDGKTAATLCVD